MSLLLAVVKGGGGCFAVGGQTDIHSGTGENLPAYVVDVQVGGMSEQVAAQWFKAVNVLPSIGSQYSCSAARA